MPAERGRQVALHGLRRWAGQGLTPIARRMGVRYSAVSRRVSAVAAGRSSTLRWAAALEER